MADDVVIIHHCNCIRVVCVAVFIVTTSSCPMTGVQIDLYTWWPLITLGFSCLLALFLVATRKKLLLHHVYYVINTATDQ